MATPFTKREPFPSLGEVRRADALLLPQEYWEVTAIGPANVVALGVTTPSEMMLMRLTPKHACALAGELLASAAVLGNQVEG